MDADTGNGGLRSKRCLPAEFHPGTAHQNPPRTNRPESFLPTHALRRPQVAATIVTVPRSSTHAFLPIITQSLPYSSQRFTKLRHRRRRFGYRHRITKLIINDLKSITYRMCADRIQGQSKGPGLDKPGPFSSSGL